MIFAEIKYPHHYSDVHSGLVALVEQHFSHVQSGLQGDSWIWIMDGGEKVSIDTFTSMIHQVKSAKAGPHVQRVVEVLLTKYQVAVYEAPAEEGHDV